MGGLKQVPGLQYAVFSVSCFPFYTPMIQSNPKIQMV